MLFDSSTAIFQKRCLLFQSNKPNSFPDNDRYAREGPERNSITNIIEQRLRKCRSGPLGIEPRLRVLETLVLPLYDGPAREILNPEAKTSNPRLFFCFFVYCMLATPFAILFHFDFTGDELTVLARPIVDARTL